jgi:hypothetical protein
MESHKLERELIHCRHEIEAKDELIKQLKRLVGKGEDELHTSRYELTMSMHQIDCLEAEKKQTQLKVHLLDQSNQEQKTQIGQLKEEVQMLHETNLKLHAQLNESIANAASSSAQERSSVKRKLDDMERNLDRVDEECHVHCKSWIEEQRLRDEKTNEIIALRLAYQQEAEEKQAQLNEQMEEIKKLTRESILKDDLYAKKDKLVTQLSKQLQDITECDAVKQDQITDQLKEQEQQLSSYRRRLIDLADLNHLLKDENEQLVNLRDSGKEAVSDLNEIFVQMKEDLLTQLKEKETENLRLQSKLKEVESKTSVTDDQSMFVDLTHIDKVLQTSCDVTDEIKHAFATLYERHEETIREVELQKQQIEAMLRESEHSNLLLYCKNQDLDKAQQKIKEIEEQLSEVAEFDVSVSHQIQSEQQTEIERLKEVCKNLEEEKTQNLNTIADLLSHPEVPKSQDTSATETMSPQKVASNAFLREKNAELVSAVNDLKQELKKQAENHLVQLDKFKAEIEKNRSLILDLKLENTKLKTLVKKKDETNEQMGKALDAANLEKEQIKTKNIQKSEKIKKVAELLTKQKKENVHLKANNETLESLNEELTAQSEEIKNQKAKLVQQLEEKFSRIRQLENELSVARHDNLLTDNLSSQQFYKQILDLQAQLRLSEKETAQSKMELVRTTNQLHHLKQQFAESEEKLLREKVVELEVKQLKTNIEVMRKSLFESQNKENRPEKRKLVDFLAEHEKRKKTESSSVCQSESITSATLIPTPTLTQSEVPRPESDNVIPEVKSIAIADIKPATKITLRRNFISK